jgi:hypothetical protein
METVCYLCGSKQVDYVVQCTRSTHHNVCMFCIGSAVRNEMHSYNEISLVAIHEYMERWPKGNPWLNDPANPSPGGPQAD